MILTAGLSPAWQQIIRLKELRAGEVNRAEEVHWCASGKVINVAWALSSLGVDSAMLSTVGGAVGDILRQQVEKQGIRATWVETTAATRVCTTVLDSKSNQVTELVENATRVSDAEIARFVDAYQQLVRQADFVVLTGSLPAGAPATLYRDLLRMTPCPALLDFRGPELLAALECRPLVVKPNREELGHTLGVPISDDGQLQRGVEQLHVLGAQWVAITDGANPLLARSAECGYWITPPRVDAINPIGAGDCLAAGTAWGIVQGLTVPEALGRGVAAAAENVKQLLPARLDVTAVRRLATSVLLERL